MNAPLNIVDVILGGAVRPYPHRECPWCGEYPRLARQVHKYFLVGCESDDCPADGVQCSGATVEEAWRKWDSRATPRTTDLERAGEGGIK